MHEVELIKCKQTLITIYAWSLEKSIVNWHANLR